MDILSIARWYVEHGLSVIPIKADGSKSPAYTGWRKFSNERPCDEQLVEWFSGTALVGLGIPAGPASGNLVILDFEHAGTSAYFEWIQRLPDDLRKFAEALPTATTPTGGKHLYIRLEEPQPGAKLARYAGGKTKIEIRGEGHQVLAPGCPAECHPTKKLYEWSNEPEDFPEVDLETCAALVDYCCQCNEYQAPEQPRDRDVRGIPAGMDSPGNDFNVKGMWSETGLFDAGWTWSRGGKDDKGFLTRPGKESGISASVGMVSSKEKGYPYLYVWSTATDFTAETPFSRFAVYAMLKHAGDFSAAAKELARLGYGARKQDPSHVDFSEFTMRGKDGEAIYPFRVSAESPEAGPTTEGPTIDNKPFKWASELNAQAENVKWIWKGYLKRGGITLFSALWKSGKSTLLSHLLKSLDGSQSEFIGLEVTPSRILYVSEEDESIWADRRDELLLGDHVGFWCRPFKMRPTVPEWKAFIAAVAEQVRTHHFDLVVFDTLSKMWPVREENDAGQVEEALMPLWTITNEDTSVMLIHHNRKSGGDHFVGARGSGGLSAFAEILMEFSPTSAHPKETKRLIKAKGRFRDIPVQLVAELDHGRYVGLGDPDDDESPIPKKLKFTWEDDVMTTLRSTNGEWLSFADLQESIPEQPGGKGVRKSDLLKVLGKWFDGGEIERDGVGRGASPYLYRVAQEP